MRVSLLSILLSLLSVVAWPTLTHAEPTRSSAREADTLFREGKARLAAQDYVTACPLLAASYEKDPATGTLLALAVCHERQSDLVSALREYREVVQRAHAEGRGDRRDAAQARVTALEALANETRPATTDAPTEPAETPVAETPEPSTAPVEAVEAVEPAVTVVQEPDVVEAPAPAPSTPASLARTPSRSHDNGGITWMQGSGWGTIGVGVFGLGTSLAFTLQAISKNNDSKEGCVVNRCTPEGAKDRNDARASGTAATITGVIAGALVAGGVAMVIFGGSTEAAPARESAHVAPWLAPQLVGASATGTF